ncbi:hypothetical protein BKA61DRAFT_616141 [Leptodontidium sp. MPI-SDFR-AT-0119]|nr:hypothetical protein BKA61DRAFT_616141 [Leptodontidium sp. MPI-SDFR-AT-0119]
MMAPAKMVISFLIGTFFCYWPSFLLPSPSRSNCSASGWQSMDCRCCSPFPALMRCSQQLTTLGLSSIGIMSCT